MRVASYVMCEKHSVKKAFKFGVLYNGIAGISGQVGITNIYRGGMDVYRYRADGEDPAHVPSHGQMAEFAVFAVGYQNKDAIKVKLEEAYPKGEKFRVTWDKTFEIDGSCLAQHASQRISDPYPFFDYVSAFTKAIKDRLLRRICGSLPSNLRGSDALVFCLLRRICGSLPSNLRGSDALVF